jgi:hypothetical protein
MGALEEPDWTGPPNLRDGVLELLEVEAELVQMAIRPAAVRTSVFGEDRADAQVMLVEEANHLVIEHVALTQNQSPMNPGRFNPLWRTT